MELRVVVLFLFLFLYHVDSLSPDLLVVVAADNPLQHLDTHAETPLHHPGFVPYPQTETNPQPYSPQLHLAQTTKAESTLQYDSALFHFAPLKRLIRLCCHRVRRWLCHPAGLS